MHVCMFLYTVTKYNTKPVETINRRFPLCNNNNDYIEYYFTVGNILMTLVNVEIRAVTDFEIIIFSLFSSGGDVSHNEEH